MATHDQQQNGVYPQQHGIYPQQPGPAYPLEAYAPDNKNQPTPMTMENGMPPPSYQAGEPVYNQPIFGANGRFYVLTPPKRKKDRRIWICVWVLITLFTIAVIVAIIVALVLVNRRDDYDPDW